MNLRRWLLRPKYILVEPGVNPLDNDELINSTKQHNRRQLFKVLIVIWALGTGLSIWYAVAQPGAARAEALHPDEPQATATPTKTATATQTPAPTATALLGGVYGQHTLTPYSLPGAHQAITLTPAVTVTCPACPACIPVVQTKIVNQTVLQNFPVTVLARATVLVPVVQTVIVPGATQPAHIITETPGPSQTPWIILITQVVTATPTETPTPTLTTTPSLTMTPTSTETETETPTPSPTSTSYEIVIEATPSIPSTFTATATLPAPGE